MASNIDSVPVGPRYSRLALFLEQDPRNPSLIADTAQAAWEAGASDVASALIERFESLGGDSPALTNLKGLIALSGGKPHEAIDCFEGLRASGIANPPILLNLAWARMVVGDYEGSLDLLEEEVVNSDPKGPGLKTQLLHLVGRLDEALEYGALLTVRRPADQSLMGVLAVIAMDAGRADLARSYAALSAENDDGLTTLGMFALDDNQIADANILFENALARNPRNARAWIGKGLGQLLQYDSTGAARSIDQGAALFGNHIGSWVAAGWAHFSAGEYDLSRERFSAAIALDDRFSEAHGGLAMVDYAEGRKGSANRRAEIAFRLDRKCLGAALVRSLMLADSAQTDLAERVQAIALSQPVGPDGKTIAQALIQYGMGKR